MGATGGGLRRGERGGGGVYMAYELMVWGG